jgi:L,D-transpeptidase catalytic domain
MWPRTQRRTHGADHAPAGRSPAPLAAVALSRAAVLLGAVALLSGTCGGVARASASAAVPQAARASVATLSNLRTLSRWAYPLAAAVAHEDPSASSRVVGRLEFLTSDGQAEVYLALRSYTFGATTWILVELPGRPNGLTGWVPAGALGELNVTDEYLRVDLKTLSATLFREGRAIWSARVGVGRPSLPTPVGHFYVTEKLAGDGGPFYGPYQLGTSAYAPTLSEWPGGGVVGIHGTNEPQLIPGRPSHGCIRLRNADITRLWPLIGVGTPIEIV